MELQSSTIIGTPLNGITRLFGKSSEVDSNSSESSVDTSDDDSFDSDDSDELSTILLDDGSSDFSTNGDTVSHRDPITPVKLDVENLELNQTESRRNTIISNTLDPTVLPSATNFIGDTDIDGNIDENPIEGNIEVEAEIVDTNRILDPTCYFDDGQRIIDFVLVYKESRSKRGVERSENRQLFEEKLYEVGIDIEHEYGLDDFHFLKLHAKWDCLARQAELMQLLAPIQENNDCDHNNWWGSKLVRMAFKRDPFVTPKQYEAEEKVFYNSRFDQRRMEIFLCPDKDKFFTQTQRIRIVHSVLHSCSVGFDNRGYNEIPMNLEFFLRNGTYLDAFPLHDGSVHDGYADVKKNLPYRTWLKDVWANTAKVYQPIPQIRAYFGDKIAIYFSLMGVLTKQLLIPSLLAIICLFYGIYWACGDNPTVRDICNSQEFFCRTCRRTACPQLAVNQSCGRMYYVNVFDNVTLIFYSVFICLWGVFFLEIWKKVQAEFASKGDSTGQADSHSIRFDYIARATKTTFSPESGAMEPTHSTQVKIGRMMSAMLTTLFFIGGLTGFLFGVALYRMVAVDILRRSNSNMKNVSVVAWFSASLITGLKQIFFEIIYRKIAIWLAKLECPVTERQFEESFVRKFMMFQFVNYYGELAYVGVLKGQFAGSPHNQPLYADRCSPFGCYVEANLHFVIVVTCKEVVYLLKIYVWPKIESLFKSPPAERLPRWERDFKLNEISNVGLSVYYEDLVITYGFIVLFGSYLPVATCTVLLYFLVKIRIDANHLLTLFKRPVPESCQNIGVWMNLLAAITSMATLSNALIIAFSSQYVDRIVYQSLYSKDGSLTGFVNFMICEFDTADYTDLPLRYNVTNKLNRICSVKEYRYSYNSPTKYDREASWWVVMVGKLAFIIMFEHLVKILQNMVKSISAGDDENTKLQLERRKLLEKRAYVYCEMEEKRLKDAELKRLRDAKKMGENIGGRRRHSLMSNISDNKRRLLKIKQEMGDPVFGFNPFKQAINEPNDNPVLRKHKRERRNKTPFVMALYKWLIVNLRS